MRAILASGGYSGVGRNISLADSTCPPTRIRLGVAAFGGGGGGGALPTPPIMPPITPPALPPGTPPGTPPTTPTLACGGGAASSLIMRTVLGITVGAFMISSTVTRRITRTGAAAGGGGGGGGG